MATSACDSFARLLKQARNGCSSALGRLLDDQRDWLKGIAARRLPPALAAHEDPSDLAQECEAVAAKRLSRFQGNDPRQFRAWLKGILDRRIKRVFRYWGQAQRDTRREVRPGPLDHAAASKDGDALSRLVRSEDENRQRELLGTLTK